MSFDVLFLSHWDCEERCFRREFVHRDKVVQRIEEKQRKRGLAKNIPMIICEIP